MTKSRIIQAVILILVVLVAYVVFNGGDDTPAESAPITQ